MIKQSKGERLFNNAYREALGSIKTWGTGRIDALSSLHDGTDENIYQRTVDAIRMYASFKTREVDFRERHGEDMSEQREALAIVLKACDNWERDEADLNARLAAL